MFAKDFWDGPVMSSDPRRFAQLVLEAFAAAGNHTDAQIARAAGPSTSTMTKLRKVAEGRSSMPEPREPTWTKIDNAAAWAPGSARRVWRGEEPVLRPDSVGGVTQDPGDYVNAPGARVESGVSNEDLLREILRSRAEYDQLRGEVGTVREGLQSLSARVAQLEQQGS